MESEILATVGLNYWTGIKKILIVLLHSELHSI